MKLKLYGKKEHQKRWRGRKRSCKGWSRINRGKRSNEGDEEEGRRAVEDGIKVVRELGGMEKEEMEEIKQQREMMGMEERGGSGIPQARERLEERGAKSKEEEERRG